MRNKFGQVKKGNKGNIFFKSHTENEPGKLFPDLFCFFKNLNILRTKRAFNVK